MKSKIAFPIVATLLMSFACQLFQQPSANDTNLIPTQTQDVAVQSTAISTSTSEAQAQPIPSLDSASAEIYNADMVLVPEGEFIMGNNYNNTSRNIYLDAYYIDKYEVTNVLYKSCVDAGICAVPHKEFSASSPSYYGDSEFDNYPVIYVDWFMAEAFCAWRGTKLPTEAEWEKAARGTDGRTYPWGEDNTAYAHRIYFVGGIERDISPYGIYDMGLNVAEWVADWFSKTYYQDSPLENPLGPENGTMRVVRGGAPFNPEPVPTFSRNRQPPSDANENVGFRCAKDATP